MNINSEPDAEYICTHCEAPMDDIDNGVTIHIDLGYGTVYTVCATCAKNLVS